MSVRPHPRTSSASAVTAYPWRRRTSGLSHTARGGATAEIGRIIIQAGSIGPGVVTDFSVNGPAFPNPADSAEVARQMDGPHAAARPRAWAFSGRRNR